MDSLLERTKTSISFGPLSLFCQSDVLHTQALLHHSCTLQVAKHWSQGRYGNETYKLKGHHLRIEMFNCITQIRRKCKIDDTLEVTRWSQVRGQSVHSRRRAMGYSARGYNLTLFASYNKRLEVFVKS